jgi:D-threo-aldose 1-dehydrogenase
VKPSEIRTNGRSGVAFTAFGFGGAPIGNFNGAFSETAAFDMVAQSWKQGVRFFDTAPGYGNGLSEYRLGNALRHFDREQAAVSTKVGRVLTPTLDAPKGNGQYLDIPPLVAGYDYSYDGVMRAVEQSMQRMLTDHFDMLFIHDCDRYSHGADYADYLRQAIVSAFPALESLREQGVVKAIGFGVNDTDVMTEAVRATDSDVCLLAGRYTLLEQEPLDDLLPICEERGVGIVLGGVYNSGILAKGPVPGARFNYGPAPKEVLDKAARIDDVCRRHGVALAAVAVQFAYAHPAVMSICLGSRDAAQQQRNVDHAETAVPHDLWDDLRDRGLVRPDAPTPV